MAEQCRVKQEQRNGESRVRAFHACVSDSNRGVSVGGQHNKNNKKASKNRKKETAAAAETTPTKG